MSHIDSFEELSATTSDQGCPRQPASPTNQEEPQQTTVRFTTDDLKRTLGLIGYDKAGETEPHFANGLLLARNENADGLVRQALVPVLEGSGDPIAFRVSNEKLQAMIKLDRDVQMRIVARDRFSCLVHTSETSDDSKNLCWECQRIPVEDRTLQGQLLPGTLLRELLRVVEPFAFDRQRSCLEPMERVDLIGMTRHGLECHSPDGEWVCYEVPGLVESPWSIPVANLQEVCSFTRSWKSFCIGTDDERCWITDGRGAVVSWRTRVPVDVGVEADSFEPDLDQFVATVSATKLQSALGSMVSRIPSSDCTVVLRISPLDRLISFEVENYGATCQSSVPVHVERNRLEGEVEAHFVLGSLRKVLTGTSGRSVQLRLHRHEGSQQAKWCLRSIDTYTVGGLKRASSAKPDAQPVPCRVTRMATSLVRYRPVRTKGEKSSSEGAAT